MNDTVAERAPDSAARPNPSTPAPRAAFESWLSAFDAALAGQDIQKAVNLFTADCHWRDLVSFTWNLKTVEGHDGVRDLLEKTLARTKPTLWRIEGEPSATNDMTEGWFVFETRDRPRPRLRRLEGRSLLDAADHRLRAQGPRGEEGAQARHGRRARRAPRPQELAGAPGA